MHDKGLKKWIRRIPSACYMLLLLVVFFTLQVPDFLSPENMTKEIQDYCRRTGQQVPETLGEIATVIYTSLAECYARTAKSLEEMTGRTYSRIHIVGGGANAGYLNELTAKATGKEVHAGPTEATAIGNITAQMLEAGEFGSVEEARSAIHQSFDIKIYK